MKWNYIKDGVLPRDCKEFLREDQGKAWCSFSEIYADFEDKGIVRRAE